MFIKVRDDFRQLSRQPVPRKEAWLSILVVVVLVVGISISMTSMGKHSVWESRANWLYLGVVWAVVIYQAVHGLFHYKRWVYPLPIVALIVGLTLSVAGHELPHSWFALSWVQGVGNLLFLIGLLSQFLQFGWGRRPPSDSTLAGPPA